MRITKITDPGGATIPLTCIEALTPTSGDPASECSANSDTLLYDVGGVMTMCTRHLFLLGRGIADLLAAERGVVPAEKPESKPEDTSFTWG